MSRETVGQTSPEMSAGGTSDPGSTGAFSDRVEAGQVLGALLRDRSEPGRAGDIVFGLARGGVPVAAEVASMLHVPCEVLVVRKLGVPSQPEFAFGALAENEAIFIDSATVDAVGLSGHMIDAVVRREAAELQKRVRKYRGNRPLADVRDRHILLVDDGLATGATMRAAVRLMKQRGAKSVTVAVPVGAPESVGELSKEADVVCARTPPDFGAVGFWYRDFNAPTDDEIRTLLDLFRIRPRAGA